MKVIIIISSYFQLIVAIQLKRTVLKECEVDVVITDKSSHAEKVYKKLQNVDLFNKVILLQCREYLYAGNFIEKTMKYLYANFFPKHVFKELDLIEDKYDLLLYHNDTLDAAVIYDILHQRNNLLKCRRFEEGYSIYIPLENTKTRGNKLRNMLWKKNLREITELVYLFHPSLAVVDFPYPVFEIEKPTKNDKELKDICNYIFEYHKDEEHFKKYIFFEEAFATDGEYISDLELVKEIADIVGKENIVVKLHPRSFENRFEKLGISTTKSGSVPWEVIQMNYDLGEHVLLTISSGSVLASALYFNENVKTYMLYACLDKKPKKISEEFIQYMSKVMQCSEKNIVIPSSNVLLTKMLLEEQKEY